MNSVETPGRSAVGTVAYELLDPIPFGCFVAALIFDVAYARSAELMWDKSAAWLIVIALFVAVVPRLINLMQVWVTSRRAAPMSEKLDFWLNFFAIAAGIVNAFVHSRDGYAVVPAGLWLSACTVALLSIARGVAGLRHAQLRSPVHA